MGNYFDLKSTQLTKFALPQKIAIVGPESTGKSQLAQQLAQHFHEPWVPEMARPYLEKFGPNYSATDIETIARWQLAEEERLTPEAQQFLFCDTTLLVIKIWMEHAFGQCPDWILQSVKERHYDHYLLCDIDLPWEPDPLREHPHQRHYFAQKYRQELETLHAPYSLISGTGKDREKMAIDLIMHW